MGQSLRKGTANAQERKSEDSGEHSSDKTVVELSEELPETVKSSKPGRSGILVGVARRLVKSASKENTFSHRTICEDEVELNDSEKHLAEVPIREEASGISNDDIQLPTKNNGNGPETKRIEADCEAARSHKIEVIHHGTELGQQKSGVATQSVRYQIPTPNLTTAAEGRQQLDISDEISIHPVEKLVLSCFEELSEEEKALIETELQQLETPIRWLSAYYGGGEASACAKDESGDAVAGANERIRKPWRDDHFRVATYHLWQSARYCLDTYDCHKALKELTQAKCALKRFEEEIQKQELLCTGVSEGQRGDQDVVRSLTMVIYSSLAHISFQMGKYNDTKRLLHEVKTKGVSHGSEAAIRGIEASVLTNSELATQAAVNIVQEAATMDPNYWRWHALFAALLQRLPEPNDPYERMIRREDIFTALEKVSNLKKNDAKCTLLLANAYRNAVFQVHYRKDSLEDHQEYAKQAVHTFMAAMDRAPQCALTHALAARSLWSLRKMCREASRRGISAAEKAMAIMLGGDFDDGRENEDEMTRNAEAAMILGLLWESIGNIERAQVLLRVALSNPFAQPHVAYKAELGEIICCFRREKTEKPCDPESKANILHRLDKLMNKFSDNHYRQQILCHRGQYLMNVMKDNDAALTAFCEAISINTRSDILKRFFPKFCTIYQRPLRIPDLVHELACKELTTIIVRAKKGSPTAVRRSNYLNECLQLTKDVEVLEDPTLVSYKEQTKSDKDAAALRDCKEKSVYNNEMGGRKEKDKSRVDDYLFERCIIPNKPHKSGEANDDLASEIKHHEGEDDIIKPLRSHNLAEQQKKSGEDGDTKNLSYGEFWNSRCDNLERIEHITEPLKAESDGEDKVSECDSIRCNPDLVVEEEKHGILGKENMDLENECSINDMMGIYNRPRVEAGGKNEVFVREDKNDDEWKHSVGKDEVAPDVAERNGRGKPDGLEGGYCVTPLSELQQKQNTGTDSMLRLI